MSWIVSFEQAEANVVNLVGGKGSNLSALTAAGFPVPPGFVVTAQAYERFLAGAPDFERQLAALDYEQPERLRQQCDALRERLAQVPLPREVDAALRAALASFPPDTPFAVRSSSTFEDLAQAAFAGQHDTYLNVRGADEIVRRVRDCFLSLWQDRAVLYRRRQGFAQAEARMAVVVQRQIACDRAGVGFSIDPVSGRLDRLVLDANYGLGESVVAGECEIDHLELDKQTLEVRQQTIGRKTMMVVAVPEGTQEREVPAAQAESACLAPAHVRATAELLKKVEAHYGWPQDIEWGWDEEKLYLFQSRPVTTFPPRWTRDESAERFPRPMTPLSWDFLQVAFRRSAQHSLALMGLPPLQGDWFGWFDHWIYGNQSAVALIAAFRPLKARSPQELMTEIPHLRRRFGWVLELPVRWARDLDRYLIRLGRLQATSLEGATIPEMVRHIDEAIDVATEYFQPNIAISMTQAFLHRLLHALVAMAAGPERALPIVDGLLAGCDTKTAVVNRELHELAQLASRTYPTLDRALAEIGGAELLRRGGLAEFPEFAARFGRFLEDHGHREMDMDYYHPTWSEQPGLVLDAVALILRGQPEDPVETARQHRVRYAETEHRFLGQVPDELRFFFREMVRLARTYTVLDDLEHYQTTRINPVARRAVLALGRRLHEQGVLDEPADIFFLRKTDVDSLTTPVTSVQLRELGEKARAGKAAYQAAQARQPAWALDDAGAADDAAPNDVQTLRGLPGSPGVASGPCFRVLAPEDFARFPKDAILVARTTNPAWTPLFYSARALITESGGPLSHGAVTAREMALPAVMSVRDVMQRLHDGQIVTVDGTRGLVTV